MLYHGIRHSIGELELAKPHKKGNNFHKNTTMEMQKEKKRFLCGT